jgi:multimeric flavodoxin WrbA
MDPFDLRLGRISPVGSRRKFAQTGNGFLEELNSHIRHLEKVLETSRKKGGKTKILIINCSHRNEDGCPQETSKSVRLCDSIIENISGSNVETKLLDLSRATSEKGKNIWACKGCFSTSPALCHFGCSCYPNEELGQNPDWMHDEIYELLLESHGVFFVSPTYWYSMPGLLKNMLDRMVCLDGANPDPSTTLTSDGKSVKDAKKAKALERGPKEGGDSIWEYIPKKAMAGKVFAAYVHGDADGPDGATDALVKTLKWFGMIEASSSPDAIGYMKPYSDSHKHLDDYEDAWKLVKYQANVLVEKATKAHADGMPLPDLPPEELQK